MSGNYTELTAMMEVSDTLLCESTSMNIPKKLILIFASISALFVGCDSTISGGVDDLNYATNATRRLSPLDALSFDGKNVSELQWKLFTSTLRAWNGYWVRYSANGTRLENTFFRRKYTHEYPNIVIRTMTYLNPNFTVLGSKSSVSRALYIHKLPLVDNIHNLNGNLNVADWTETKEQATKVTSIANAYLFFYPPFFSLGGVERLTTSTVFGFEKFVRPTALSSNVRLSVSPIYYNGMFERVSVLREVSFPLRYGKTGFWSYKSVGYVKEKDNFAEEQSGTWFGTKYCIDKKFYFSAKRVKLSAPGGLVTPGDDRVTLELPDDVLVSFPKDLSQSMTNGEKTTFSYRWVAHPYQVFWSETTYDEFGEFSQDCTSIVKKF